VNGRSARIAILIAVTLVTLEQASPAAAGPWRRPVAHARSWAHTRAGEISFAVVSENGAVHGWRVNRTSQMASTIKVMFLTAYLRHAAGRNLQDRERALLGSMIRRSNSAAASWVADTLGPGPIYALARAAGMHDFTYTRPWGESRDSPRDQARFLFDLRRYLPARHEAYALKLLSHIIPSQSWGIGRIRLGRWKRYFKGGWGSGVGRTDHQVALLENRDRHIGVAIMTEFDPSHTYGKQTLLGLSRRLVGWLRHH
jgi:beta-lactamase family protein